MNHVRIMCLAAGLAFVLPAVAIPITAQAQSIGIEIGVPPPPERVEVIPPLPGPGFVWDRGHWRWEGGAHVWVPGHYIRLPHPGAVRIPGHWVQLPNGRYRFVPPHWE